MGKKNQQKREQNKMQKLEKKEEKIEAKIGGVCNKLNAQNDGAKSDKLMQKKQKLMAKQEKLQQKVEKIVSKKDKKAPVVIDELQLLDDIANAAVKDLGLNEDQKQEPVLSSLSCVCGSLLHKTSPIKAYNASSQVNCDICGCFIPSSGVIYHCPNLQSVHHPEGYDLCPNCVEYQKQFEKQPPLKKKVEKKVPVAPKEEEFKYKYK